MKYEIKKQNTNAIIDFVIAVAHKGGVENVMNQVARYLTVKGLRVRFIQLVYEHQLWACEEAEFYYIYEDRNGQTLDSFIDGYYAFLKEHDKPDMIFATNWPMMCTVARIATEKSGINVPIASWLHNPLERYEAAGYGGIEHLKNADMHFAINDTIKNLLFDNGEKIVYRSYNPIGKTLHYNDNRNPYKLAFIGRLSEQKNLSVIIRALSFTKDYNLLIIGEGDEEVSLKKLVKELNLESRVTFYGWSDDPWALAKDCGFLIISSIFEGGPLIAIEALHSGIPVISSPVGIITEIIENGINGYLFPQGDYEFLASILNLISDGKLAVPSSEACQASACQYKEAPALFDFYAKINSTLEGRIIQENRDKISIIVPCYNVEKLVGRCIDSILHQTLPREMIELILINDASTDNTLGVLAQYEKQYPELIMVINFEENGKQGRARNIGLNYASGNYIMYVDADDYIADTMLEKMYLAALKYPVDMVECQFRMFDDNGWIESKATFKQDNLVIIENIDDRRNYFINNAFNSSASRRLFKRNFIEQADLYFPENVFMEDLYFSQLAVSSLTASYIINEQMYFYYKNTNGTIHSSSLKTYYMDVHHMQAKTIEELIRRNSLNSCNDALAFVYFKKVLWDLYLYIKNTFGELSGEHKLNLETMKDYLHNLCPDMTGNPYMSPEDIDNYYIICTL